MTDPSTCDQELMARIRTGDASAFEALMMRYQDRVVRHVARMVRDGSADDLAQEVFLRVWTRADQWDGRGVLAAWLLRVATNLALNHLRTVRRRRERPLTAAPDLDEEGTAPGWMVDASSVTPEDRLVEAEERRRLGRLVERLPEDKRQVLRLVFHAEMDVGDIARTLGIPAGTVRSRLYYARRTLAREWEEEG